MAHIPVEFAGRLPGLQIIAFGQPGATPLSSVPDADGTQPYDPGGHPQGTHQVRPTRMCRAVPPQVHAELVTNPHPDPSAALRQECDIDQLAGRDLADIVGHDHQTVGLGQRSQQMR